MGAHVINGNDVAAELKKRLTEEVGDLARNGVRPGLTTMLVGATYAAEAYERRVRRLADDFGYHYVCEALPESAEEAEVIATVGKLNADPRVSGVLILRPLPTHVSEAAVYRMLDPTKDIEAVHPENVGLLALGRPRYVPSTPAACFHILDRYLTSSGRNPASFYARSNVVIVGRSNNVGKPAVTLGHARNATVISCDEHAYYAGRLQEHTLRADALIVAAGVPHLINGDYIRKGVVAVDVGINPVKDPNTGKTRLVGDLDFDSVAAKAEGITPVPGGVGPVTDVLLLSNAAHAAKYAVGLEVARSPEEQYATISDAMQATRSKVG